MQKEDTGTWISCSEMMSSLDCGICLTEMKEPMMTECGHTFCKDCIERCIISKQQCPDCKTRISRETLKKNQQVEIIQAHFHKLQIQAQNQLALSAMASTQNLLCNPFLPVFQARIQDSMEKYAAYSKYIAQDLEEYSKQVKTTHARLLMEGSKTHADPQLYQKLQQEERTQLDHANSISQQAMQTLLLTYEEHLKTAVPEPDLRTFLLTIFVPSKLLRLDRLPFRPHDTLKDVRQAIEKYQTGRGNPVVEWGADVQYVVITPAPDSSKPAEDSKSVRSAATTDESMVLYKLPIGKDCVIEVSGKIVYDSEIVKPCITYNFDKDKVKPCNYYACTSCGLNWICEPCIRCCHKGHVYQSHISNHIPTWSCCKCLTICCTLPNKNTPSPPPDQSPSPMT
jgi:hypothetical protein